MEILILGDSLVYGRPSHGIGRSNTWPILLGNRMSCSVQVRARGGSLAVDVFNESRYLFDAWFGDLPEKKFDATFIQVGIVDCCPRLFPKRLYSLLKGLPIISRIQRLSTAYSVFGAPWTSKKIFAENIKKTADIVGEISDSVFFVMIAPPFHFLLKNVGDFSAEVADYNRMLKLVVGDSRVVDWDPTPDRFLPDGHHLSLSGHEALADSCFSIYKNSV